MTGTKALAALNYSKHANNWNAGLDNIRTGQGGVQSAEINEKFSDLHPDIFRSLWKFIYYPPRISLSTQKETMQTAVKWSSFRWINAESADYLPIWLIANLYSFFFFK